MEAVVAVEGILVASGHSNLGQRSVEEPSTLGVVAQSFACFCVETGH